MIYNLKLALFILITLVVYSAELLTDFSYTNFTVSYRDALDRLRVQLNIILLSWMLVMVQIVIPAAMSSSTVYYCTESIGLLAVSAEVCAI